MQHDVWVETKLYICHGFRSMLHAVFIMLSSSCCLHTYRYFIPIIYLSLLYTYRHYIPTAIIYLSLHCHHHSDSCIKMGNDESHFFFFNVSFIVKDKVTRQCPQTTTFFQGKGKPKRNRAEALLLTLIVRDKVTRQCPQTTTFFEERGEPKRNRTRGPAAYEPVY